ncbi:hypothetical protein UA08_08399 [Talaromyces atroroseus]|uniref:Uncharacterized protein n=1 Tax=Talaromyces atroroseus TaxID=1441469 RepID=A0A1Q5Q7L0_TALAT|nr:hypothetical protein UA08_08399 [Talaromyces atroroseus]OKL56196.1 hypothetical protein UA08_08399 [Talaromyces atroroseus]
MAASQQGIPLEEPSANAEILLQYELSPSAIFPAFTASTAFDLGCAIRNRILSLPASQRKPAVVSITSCQGNQTLFHAVTESGTTPDNEEWVRRKRNTVLRWACSTWALRRKMVGSSDSGFGEAFVEKAFAQKHGLKSSVPEGVPDDYAIHGGGFPIKVESVDGIVGVIVVSGLKQHHDHQVIVETISDYLKR